MQFVDQLGLPLLDAIAVAMVLLLWIGYTFFSLLEAGNKTSLRHLMHTQRLQWMQEMCARDNRIVDATIVGNQLRGVSFFASTTVLLLAALISLLGVEQSALTHVQIFHWISPESAAAWKLKTLLLAAVMVYAFFRFTWSMRQYQFTGVLVGSAPGHHRVVEEGERQRAAERAAGVASSAAYAFNTGLRAYYFAFAMLGWFVHPVLMLAMAALVVAVLYRREFHSRTVANLLA